MQGGLVDHGASPASRILPAQSLRIGADHARSPLSLLSSMTDMGPLGRDRADQPMERSPSEDLRPLPASP